MLLLWLLAPLAQDGYYVDAEKGDDGASGASPETPWKSAARVGAAPLKPGDRVLFRRGQTFEGPLRIRRSGREDAPLLFGAYGEGAPPEISGFVEARGWTRVAPGIWEASLPTSSPPNLVVVDDLPRALGRTPNEGWLSVDAHAGRTSITDAELPEGDWTGAELVLRKVRWILDRDLVTGRKGSTLTFTPSSSYDLFDGHGYFLQNHPATLDRPGEWYFDPRARTLRVVFGEAAGRARASGVDVLVSARDQRDLVFDGLKLSGANKVALDLDGAARIRVVNCVITRSGRDAVRGAKIDGLRMEDCRIEETNSSGIVLDQGVSRVTLRRLTLTDTGTRAGMGASGDATYNAVVVLGGADNVLEELTITNTGYLPIHVGGARVSVRDCVIRSFCSVKDDGGGIYLYTGPNPKDPTPGREIVRNLVVDGPGAPGGALGATKAFGIYLDDVTSDVDLRENVVARTDGGLFLHNAFRCRITRNTFVDNDVQLLVIHDGIPNAEIRDIEFSDNSLIAASPAQGLFWATSMSEDVARFGRFERNHYVRPGPPDLGFRHGVRDRRPRALDLEGHRALSGLDASSRMSTPPAPAPAARERGPNLVLNGDFEKDVKEASCWSAGGSTAIERAEGKLDGGALRHRETRTGGEGDSLLMVRAGALRAGGRYLLRFSVLGAVAHGSAGVRLREGEKPWGNLTDVQDVPADLTRREVERLFEVPRSQGSSVIEWVLRESERELWIDNVSLREADVEASDDFRLELNAASAPRSVALEGAWVDVEGRRLDGPLILPPKSARALWRLTK